MDPNWPTKANPPDEGNPLGYFEDLDVIATNEAILASMHRSAWERFSRAVNRKPNVTGMGAGLSWLLDLDPRRLGAISLKRAHAIRFRELFARIPFAYKDPRFSFTLSAIAPLIPKNTSYVCVFRHPLQVVKSTRRHASRNGIVVDDAYYFGVWEAHYGCLLKHYQDLGGQWLFVSYQQLMDGEAVPRIEEFLKIQLDRTLIKEELNRTEGSGVLPHRIAQIFERLKELENFVSDPRCDDSAVRISPNPDRRPLTARQDK